jgi:tetratricopeptide (TPR) repeat protein
MMTLFIFLISAMLNSALPAAALAGPAETVRTAFETGNYSEAVKAATAALSKGQQDPSLHYWALRSYYELHDYEKAITHGEQAVRLDPANAEYNRWLGRAYGEKAEESHSFFLARKVKQAFEAAVHLSPANIPARRDLMEFLAQAPWILGGDRQKAKEQIDVISKMDSTEGHLARGSYFKYEKKWKEAEVEYAAVLDGDSRTVDCYMEAAQFFEERKDVQHIQRAVAAASRIDSKDPRIAYYNAVTLILKGNELPTAERLLRSYVANVPERSDYPSHKAAQDWLSRMGR